MATTRHKRYIEKLARLSDTERSELDKMIACANVSKGQPGKIAMGKRLECVPLSGLGDVRVWMYVWTLDGVVKGMIGYRIYGTPDKELSAFEVCAAKYFTDGVNPSSIIMHTPEGDERLK